MDSKKYEVEIKNARSLLDLSELEIKYLGRNGEINRLLSAIKDIPNEEKKEYGQKINKLKTLMYQYIQDRKKELQNKKSDVFFDKTLPGKAYPKGSLHIVSYAIEEITKIFEKISFIRVSYPEVDWEYGAFESLNMPKGHPARDEWETFFAKAKPDSKLGSQVLTPHTSNGQVREMERVKTPPIRMINIARCYRRQIDVSHTPMFHQFEGLLIDKKVSIPNLKGTFDFFTQSFFGAESVTRLRPHHFRFTEPSFEVDVICGVCHGKGCRICKSGWLELGGAGMVHPKVLKAGGIDPEKYMGFAFGWGVERTIAMKTNLPDIRPLYQNDIRFLEQF